MDDYINRRKLIEMVKMEFPGSIQTEEQVFALLNFLLKTIKSIPAADVASVVRGRWYDKGSLSCRCSECGCKNNKETTYCPNCGAKMYMEVDKDG